MSKLNPIQILKEKQASWDLLSLSEEEAVTKIREVIFKDIIQHCLANNDPLVSLSVLEDVYPRVVKALEDFDWVEGVLNVPDESIVPAAQQVVAMLQRVNVQSRKVGEFAMIAAEALQCLEPIQIFVQPATVGGLEADEIRAFVAGTGLDQFLQSTNVRFTTDQIKAAYLFFSLMSSQARKTQTQVAGAQNVQLYNG